MHAFRTQVGLTVTKIIIATVVTYNPNLEELSRLLKALKNQVSHIIVVDNGSAIEVKSFLVNRNDSSVHFLPLNNNLGIATAQNAGIVWSRDNKADYVVLFDQDSEPAPDMIAKLVEATEAMVSQGHKVGAVGPRYMDDRQNNPPPFIRVRGLKLERCACSEPNAIVSVDYLISSGCLIPMATLNAVGDMEDDLFIDYVDIEWGLRAKRFGYQSFGVCNASMRHSLGDYPLKFCGRQIPLHSPLRHYYHFRNAVWLYGQPWLPLNWKIVDAWRLLLKYGFYTLFAKPRLKQFKMMTMGLWHGLRRKMGRLDGY